MKQKQQMIKFVELLIFLLFLASPQSVYADGKIFPEKAYKTPPAIPSQRAILVYKDGIETLTIESTLNGKGQKFGWIIPLPSKPTNFEKASPGLIKTLSLNIQPEITHDLRQTLKLLYAFTTIITCSCLIVTVIKPKTPTTFFVLIFVGVFIAGILMPTLEKASRIADISVDTNYAIVHGVTVHNIQKIGSYDLTVLKADNAAALDEWLNINSFAGLTDQDKTIVTDYIEQGWFFLATKLRRQGDGYNQPHPLLMSFTSKKPVYPMRLTSTVGSSLYLELYVIAEKKATCSNLTLEVIDKFQLQEISGKLGENKWSFPCFVGKTFKQRIGHPGSLKIMWDGCVISKLCGKLLPNQMEEDIFLELSKPLSFQKHYFSKQGALHIGMIGSLALWCLLLLVLTAVLHSKINKEHGRKFVFKKIILRSIVLSLLFLAATYMVLPKIDVKAEQFSKHFYFELHYRFNKVERIRRKYNYFKDMDIRQVTKIIDDYFTSDNSKERAYITKEINHEDSPGNYIILEDKRGIVLRSYSSEGFPYDLILTSKELKFDFPSNK